MLIHRAQFSCQNMSLKGSLPGSQLFLHEDVHVPHALCHVSPSHATKSGIPWLTSRSTSHLHAGNGLWPTVWCPWAGDTTATSRRCCQDHSPAMLERSAAPGGETQPPWMAMLAGLHSLASRCLQNVACVPGSRARAPAPPDQLCFPTEGTGSGRQAEQGGRAPCRLCAGCTRALHIGFLHMSVLHLTTQPHKPKHQYYKIC